MLNISEDEFGGFVREALDSEVSITYKKGAGADGAVTLCASGLGGMLFDGACTILKELAMEDARRCGNVEMAAGYVQAVCSIVLDEMGMQGA